MSVAVTELLEVAIKVGLGAVAVAQAVRLTQRVLSWRTPGRSAPSSPTNASAPPIERTETRLMPVAAHYGDDVWPRVEGAGGFYLPHLEGHYTSNSAVSFKQREQTMSNAASNPPTSAKPDAPALH